jgi:hypothetical protein
MVKASAQSSYTLLSAAAIDLALMQLPWPEHTPLAFMGQAAYWHADPAIEAATAAALAVADAFVGALHIAVGVQQRKSRPCWKSSHARIHGVVRNRSDTG